MGNHPLRFLSSLLQVEPTYKESLTELIQESVTKAYVYVAVFTQTRALEHSRIQRVQKKKKKQKRITNLDSDWVIPNTNTT